MAALVDGVEPVHQPILQFHEADIAHVRVVIQQQVNKVPGVV